jgi:choline dehydrogenase-like flavoprotein
VDREAVVIERGRELPGSRRLRAEVCVIGSGAGGAVVGAVLAEGGRSVVVLEQGPDHEASEFNQREDSMIPLLFEEAAGRLTEDGDTSILQGRGIGGSTVHNLCYCFRAPEPILRLWEEDYGVRDLQSLDESFERVEEGLYVRQILEHELNPLNLAIRRGGDLLGYHGLIARHNRVGCIGSGFCLLGCTYEFKKSMRVTYIPRADQAGARIIADCRVDRIEAMGRRPHRIHATILDEARRPHGDLLVESPVVVCSAGAIATPLLLQGSGLGLSSGQLGRNLHLHPQGIVAALFPEPLHAYYGIPQSYLIDEFLDLERDPRSGVILMPISGPPFLSATNLSGFGREHYRHLKNLPRMGGLLALLHDRSSGEVTAGRGGRPRIRYRLEPDDRRKLVEGLKHAVEVLWAAGAESTLIPYLDEPLILRPEDGLTGIDSAESRGAEMLMSSAHPQSTCRMGEDRSRSVVNSYGELHDTPRVFVADMSVFPMSLGAPPQITTAALGDRTARHILARWPDLRGW